jgi:ATP-dependent Lon protease
MVTITVGRPRTSALVESLEAGDEVLVGVQKDPHTEHPERDDVHDYATLARVQKVVDAPRVGFRVALEGLNRVELADEFDTEEPFLTIAATRLVERVSDDARILAEALRDEIATFVEETGGSLDQALPADTDPGLVADRVASTLGLELDELVEVLAELDVAERLRMVTRLIAEQRAKSELKQKLESEVREELSKNHREAVLRQQLRAIQKELGQGEDGEDSLSELKRKLEEAELPEEAQDAVDRQLRRLESLGEGHAEHHVVRTYLETMAELPWSTADVTNEDLDAVAQVLDDDHYGLDDVKKRILEHMAVLHLSGTQRGSILCLAGPPGVGKTSLGQSIADATGREFVRISLGGVRDEAEIRGHRRTYIGSLPGRIINGLRKAGTNNPVMLLDEVDKLGKGWSGDPEAALLEVLDPEQNDTFTDHYIEVPFDLSNVLFIATANQIENLSPPLRDRLEIIEISGYTPEEKVKIARKHLVPKRLEDHSIDADQLHITDEALARIVSDYTREAGVRQLNREITKLCRSVALEVVRAKNDDVMVKVDVDDLPDYLGKKRYFSEVAARTAIPGVATGLAWTPVGGDILFIETSKMPGKGNLKITGQLGDVMTESAHAALTYVRSHADELEVDAKAFTDWDVHIHVPAGAVPKDGPSAGVTMFTALTSLLSGRRVRPDTAMTGECSLRGRVLPVGGIKAKVLAAHRAGIKRVILPERNRRDLDDVPESALEDLEILFASEMSEVLEAAIDWDHEPVVETPLDSDASGTAAPAA